MSVSFSNEQITIVPGGFVLIVAQKLQTSPLRVSFWPKRKKKENKLVGHTETATLRQRTSLRRFSHSSEPNKCAVCLL